MIEGFESHLRDDPNDLATWSAYADYLTEEGDPRGEFMAVQIALEREGTPATERTRLKNRETELLADLAPWLGPELAAAVRAVRDQHPRGVQLEFRRGWLQGVSLDFDPEEFWCEEDTLKAALAAAPESRWVLALAIDGPDRADVEKLATAPFLPTLRKLHLGGWERHSYADRIDYDDLLVANTPRLESAIFCMKEPPQRALFESERPHLRELVLGCAWSFDTESLAANASFRNLHTVRLVPSYAHEQPRLTLANLEHLANSPHLVSLSRLHFHLSDAGDSGIDVLIRSGLLYRLEVLDLCGGNVTDAGVQAIVRALAERPHHLRVLHLSDNALSAAGVAEVRKLGLDLHVTDQHDPDDFDYLHHGNME